MSTRLYLNWNESGYNASLSKYYSGWQSGSSRFSVYGLVQKEGITDRYAPNHLDFPITTGFIPFAMSKALSEPLVSGVYNTGLFSGISTYLCGKTGTFAIQVGIYNFDGSQLKSEIFPVTTGRNIVITDSVQGKYLTDIFPNTGLHSGFTADRGDRLGIVYGFYNRTNSTSNFHFESAATTNIGDFSFSETPAEVFDLPQLGTFKNPWIEFSNNFQFVKIKNIQGKAAISRGARDIRGTARIATPPYYYENTTPIILPYYGGGSTYPSTINVTGLDSSKTSVTVWINGFAYTNPRNVEILLVSPSGRNIVLMGDNSPSTTSVSGLNLTFNQSSPHIMGASKRLSGVSYLPTLNNESRFFPPAYSGIIDNTIANSNLNVVSGDDPNGTWSLYVLTQDARIGGIKSWGLSFANNAAQVAHFSLSGSFGPLTVPETQSGRARIKVTRTPTTNWMYSIKTGGGDPEITDFVSGYSFGEAILKSTGTYEYIYPYAIVGDFLQSFSGVGGNRNHIEFYFSDPEWGSAVYLRNEQPIFPTNDGLFWSNGNQAYEITAGALHNSGIWELQRLLFPAQIGLAKIIKLNVNNQTAVARIFNTVRWSINGVARIAGAGAQSYDQLGKARISTTTQRTQTGLARILTTSQRTQTGIARILNTSRWSQTCISRIKVTTTQTQSCRARIQVTTRNSQTGLARIKATSSRVQTGLARILNTTRNTQTGLSRIKTTSNWSQTCKGRIKVSTSNIQTGVARIRVSTNRTQTALARILNTSRTSQTGRARIRTTTQNSQTGVARIKAATSRSQTGLARILNTSRFTQTGVARIKNTISWTHTGVAYIAALGSQIRVQLGKARILNTVRYSQTGKANIKHIRSYTQTGIARIRCTINRTNSGLARIKASISQSQLCVARIKTTSSFSCQGKARIQRASQWTVNGLARVKVTDNNSQTGVARIKATTQNSTQGKGRVLRTIQQSQTGKGYITVSAASNRTQTGIARILRSSTQNQLCVARIKTTQNNNVNCVARIKTTSSRIITCISRISKSSTQNQTGVARIRTSTRNSISCLARIKTTTLNSTTGKGRIQTTSRHSNTGLAKIRVLKTQTLTGIARIFGTQRRTTTGLAFIFPYSITELPKKEIIATILGQKVTGPQGVRIGLIIKEVIVRVP